MSVETNRRPQAPRRVAVLSPELANQIAAGEVVERPSSVVKELVENSLDAGARRVEITIEHGGRNVIRVEDDGCGMEREDALRALERHATSKITCVDDLFSIGTLGFRGEALPSIGSVSRMEIRTKPHGELSGTRLYIEGGLLHEVEDVGMAPGTAITIEELFFNTPARLKFMKAPATESRHITEMLMRMALSRPDVGFVLRRDGKVRLNLPPVERLKDRILELLGREVYDDLYATFEYPSIGGVLARGYFSRAGHTQRSATNIYTYVNGRYVNDRTIRAAISGAYRMLLDSGRYPSVILFVDVPFNLVDVNVHPAKTEVRFHDTQPIYRAVYHALADALAQAPWLDNAAKSYALRPRGAVDNDAGELGRRLVSPAMAQLEPLNARHRRLSEIEAGREGGGFTSPFFGTIEGDSERESLQQGFGLAAASPLGLPPRIDLGELASAPPIDGEGRSAYFSKLRVIGQFRRAYIVCEDASGMVVIDQHAAHERIAFERLRLLFSTEHKQTQPLLFPLRFELDALRADCLEENIAFFESAGFEIEPFGGQSFVLKSVPAVLSSARHERLIRDALDDLTNLGRSDRVEEAMEAVLSRMACHSVVRGPTPLGIEECEGLLEQMDAIDFRANCPHGRPVYYRIPLMELEKAFERR
ncbi:MAG: DNA mismatch repair endonuclease MutL [Bradymonadaceae bacterium]|nr:DNA mismatch repair endonuclease MutL [Lujinxingiaceae bacterium]